MRWDAYVPAPLARGTFATSPSFALEYQIDDNPDPNALTPLTVEIECHGGEGFGKQIDTVYGHPSNPMTRSAWLDKFRHNWCLAASTLEVATCERVIERLENLHEVSDSAVIIDDLVP